MTRLTRCALTVAATTLAAVTGIGGTAFAAAPGTLPTAAVLGTGAAGAIRDSYIVVLRPAGTPAARVGATARRLVKRYGGRVGADYTATVRGFQASMTATAASRLAADPAVQFVEQDARVHLTGTETFSTWGLDRIDQRALPLSHTYTYGSAAGVTAYVIDTGIRLTQAEFGGRASYGYDFVDHDGAAQDCNGHGTHVAGTIGGATYGVAKDARLVAVRVLDCTGSGSYSAIVAGVDWVTRNAVKPAVANMSIGGPVSASLNAAVSRSVAAGVTYAVAAGNDNTNACGQSPAADPDAITVGATTNSDTRASFSNYGRCVDLFAPGQRITSASNRGDTATMVMSGTSMASPHVAGAAALVLGANPSWTPAQVRDALVSHATTGVITDAGSGSPNKLLYTGFLAAGGATARR